LLVAMCGGASETRKDAIYLVADPEMI